MKNNSIFTTLGATNHSKGERQKEDFYTSDPIAIDRLLSAVTLPDHIWECACGNGALSDRLIKHGYDVYSSDLVDRGYGVAGVDFLKADRLPDGVNCILTNPPYKYAIDFVLHSLELLQDGQPCYMLFRTLFLESIERYERLYSKGFLHNVFQFHKRVSCYKDGKPNGSGAVSYAWFEFRNYRCESTLLHWI